MPRSMDYAGNELTESDFSGCARSAERDTFTSIITAHDSFQCNATVQIYTALVKST